MRAEAVQSAVFLVVCDNSLAFTILHDQIQSEVFDEVIRVVSQRLAVQSVKKGMTRSVSGSTAPVCLSTFPELL